VLDELKESVTTGGEFVEVGAPEGVVGRVRDGLG